MGRPKLLLPWGNTSILRHLLAKWHSLGATQLAVVAAADDTAINLELQSTVVGTPRRRRPHAIPNPQPERGMFSSIQCAARWPGWDTAITNWVVTLGDQPHIRRDTLGKLIEAAAAERAAIWQPSRAGRRHHPVILPKSAFHRLGEAIAGDLKQFLDTAPEPRRTMEVDDPGLDLDIDTPADYEAALKLAGLV